MVPYSINKLNKKTFRFILVLSVFCAIFSCKKKGGDNGDYSDQFKAFMTELAKPVHHTTLEVEQKFIDSVYHQIKNPYTNDIFRYYGFKFLYYKKGIDKPRMALVYADSMLMAAKKSVTSKQYVSNYAEANFALGDAYFSLSQFSTAYQCFYQGYFMGKNNLKNEILAEYTYRMGMVMFKQAHYGEAANYFKISFRQSLSYKDSFQSYYQRQELLDNVGESYKNNGQTDSAAVYFTKALNYINSYSNKYKGPGQKRLIDVARAVVYGNQGEIARVRGQHELAADLLQKSIDINLRKGNDNANAELVEINLGKLYFYNRRYNAFTDLFSNLRNQLDTVKNEEAETGWNWLMSKYYEQTGDMVKAFNHLEQYNALKDSINKRSSSLKETDVNQQQANYDKQYQIENLKDNNKLQLIYIYLAVICAFMAVIIVLLIYRNWKKSKNDVKIVSDLNKRISLQKNDLETTLNELNLRSQEKDRMLRTVAHDLRNPIGGIASLTQVMMQDDFNDEQKELITLILETSNNSLELINEILEVTNNGTSQLKKELTDINSLLNNSVELLRFKASEKNQVIKLQLLEQPEDILISREKIWRVVSNLISNAIKFSPSGGTIYVKAAIVKKDLEISVQDSGIGIPDDVKDKVFNMFTEAKRPGTAGEKSFGLGLSISKQIIENHDGKIWFDSAVNSGTTFFISLPRTRHHKTPSRSSSEKEVEFFV
ncbi:MAG TPA: ATP-binding protein [Mucilaginibacter sp.]|nr:ATP-binding protein [Mucilaginibacter sp.]